MPSDETIGELSRRLDRFEQRHAQEIAASEARCTQRASTHVDSALYAAERNHLAAQMLDLKSDLATHISDANGRFKAVGETIEGNYQKLNDRLTWAFRASITGIAFPILVGLAMLIITTVGR